MNFSIRTLLLLSILSIFLMSACSKMPISEPITEEEQEIVDKPIIDETKNDGTDEPEPPTPVSHSEKAILTYEQLMNRYYIESENLYQENYRKRGDDRNFSYLWPFSGVFSAVNALAAMDEFYKTDLTQVLETLELYRDFSASPIAYDSYVIHQGGGSKFYDDNQWIGLEFVEAYKVFDEPYYLDMAKEIFEYSISGWSDEHGGGIYWQEDNKTTKNTCSNGPAAVLAMKLYLETGEERYMDWAIKILDWTKKLYGKELGVYFDHIRSDGSIDRTTWTYNTGTILHANALLYKVTEDPTYLEEARNLAKSSLSHFTSKKFNHDIEFFPNTPWFNSILFKGYLALYDVDPNKDRTYIDAFEENVEHAWTHARDHNGLFSPDWSGNTKVDEQHKWLLDQAPMVEIYALLANLE